MQSFPAVPGVSTPPVQSQLGRRFFPTTDALKLSADMLFHPLNRETFFADPSPASREMRSPPPTLYPPTSPSLSRIHPGNVALTPVQTISAPTNATLPSFVEFTAGLDPVPLFDPSPCRCTRLKFDRDCLHDEEDSAPSFRATSVAEPLVSYHAPPVPDNSVDTFANRMQHVTSSVRSGDTHLQRPVNVGTPPDSISVSIHPETFVKLDSRLEKLDIEIPLDQRVPLKLPPEVQVLVDAYVQGGPVLLIASRAIMTDVLNLAEEFAFMHLGLFVVEAVRVSTSFLDSSSRRLIFFTAGTTDHVPERNSQ